jgi:predicted nucleotidyltransferase
MADNSEKSLLEQIAGLLAQHGVEFIVIGGQAEVLFGGSRVTFDVDLCYRRTGENVRRLAAALAELHPTLRGAPADLPFRADAQTLAMGNNFTFDTAMGPLDLLGFVEPIGGYEELLPSTEVCDVGGLALRVIGLETLLAVKQHIRRAKDAESIAQLIAIKRLRDEHAEP